MDPKTNNPYSTEIPVSEAEKQLNHSLPAAESTPAAPSQPVSQTPPPETQLVQPTTPPPAPPSTPPSGTPLPPPPARMHGNILPKIIIGILVVAILSLSGYIVSNTVLNKKAPQPTPKVSSIPTPTVLPTATPIPTPDVATTSADPTSTRFYSTDLGIIFDTAKTLPATTATIQTKVVGSRVYIYGSTTQYTTGQYIDVLSKVSTDDVATAAQKIAGTDPNFKNCTFTITSQTTYPPSYQMAQPTCPAAPGAGLSYFLADSEYPTRLLFVSIGQYAMPASSNPQTKWQDTIRFIPTTKPMSQPESFDIPTPTP